MSLMNSIGRVGKQGLDYLVKDCKRTVEDAKRYKEGALILGAASLFALDYLVRDYHKTIDDAKKYTLPLGISVLAGAIAVGGVMGCDKKDKDTNSGSSAPKDAPVLSYLSDDADFYDGVIPKYGTITSPIITKIIYSDAKNRAPDYIKVRFKNDECVVAAFPMIPDASVITATLKDGDYRNGELYERGITTTTALPEEAYTVEFNASNGVDSTSTGYNSYVSILTPGDNAGWVNERSFDLIGMDIPGSIGFLEWIAGVGNKDINARMVVDALHRLDEALPDGTILYGGAKGMTRDEYGQAIRTKFTQYTNGDTNDYELPASPNYGCSLNKPELWFETNLKDSVNNDKSHFWNLDDQSREVMKIAFDIVIPRTTAKTYP